MERTEHPEPLWMTLKMINEQIAPLGKTKAGRLRAEKQLVHKLEGNMYLYRRDSVERYFAQDSVESVEPHGEFMDASTEAYIGHLKSLLEEAKTSKKEVNKIQGGLTMPKLKWSEPDEAGYCRLDCGDFTLIKREGKRKIGYRMDVRTNGKRAFIGLEKEIGRVIVDDADALETAYKIREQLKNKNPNAEDKANTTVAEFREKFLSYIERKRSYELMKSKVDLWLMPYFGKYKLPELTFEIVHGYIPWRLHETKKKNLADATLQLELTIFRRLLNVANLFNYPVNVKIVPLKELDLNPDERWRILRPDERTRLLAVADDLWQDLIEFDLNMGLRKTNICNLKWSDVDLDAQRLIVLGQESKNKDMFKLRINAKALEILDRWAEKRVPDFPYVFFRNVNGDRKQLDEGWIQKAFKRLTKKAGIDGLIFHDLRRTFGQTLADLGYDVLTVQNAMAHKDIQSTLRYVHFNEDKVNKAFDSMAEYWDAIDGNGENGVKSGAKEVNLAVQEK
jgi:integrase